MVSVDVLRQRKERVKKQTHEAFCLPRVEVEQQIMERLGATPEVTAGAEQQEVQPQEQSAQWTAYEEI